MAGNAIENLHDILLANQVDLSLWGKGEAKTFDDLVKEIESGEAKLRYSGGKVYWITACAAVIVTCQHKGKPYVLYEDRQVFADGRTRRRINPNNCAVMEKIRPEDKSPRDAAIRGIHEELGIPEDAQVSFKGEWAPINSGPRPSRSYPGLVGDYVFHTFEWQMPEELFKAEGYVERQPSKSTYFLWKEI